MKQDLFSYHKVSEAERSEIKKQAKKLLDDFASKLENLDLKDKKENSSEHFLSSNSGTKSGLRKQGEPWISNQDFIEATLENAPFVEDSSIVAETGGWK